MPMAWEEYEKRLLKEWNRLLNSNPQESDIQIFLEKHPCLIPGAFKMKGKSGHCPFPGAVISQPRLSGVGERTPDFMWLSTDSMELEVVLIEIERPDKKWFNANEIQTAQLTQAQTQLAEWKRWFMEPPNQQVFYENYELPHYLQERKLRISCALVYGRRSEYKEKKTLTRLRPELERENEFLMSFDRLTPSSDARYLYTVKKASRGYTAVAYPPTYALGPNFADSYFLVFDKDKAIDGCEWMSHERKEFIKERFPYWED